MRKFFALSLSFALSGCNLLGIYKPPALSVIPGKILYKERRDNNSMVLSQGKIEVVLRFAADSAGYQNQQCWVHGTDHFIGSIDYIRRNEAVTSKLVEYDDKGAIIRQVYFMPAGLFAIEPFVSNDDSKIVFRTFGRSGKAVSSDHAGLSVIDFNSGKLIRQFEIPSGIGSVTVMDESPWIANEDKFICSTWKPVSASDKTTDRNLVNLFLCDINSGEMELVVKDAFGAVGNPKKNNAGFFRGNDVFIYDINSGQTEKIASIEKGKLISLHWFPDGTKLFCTTRSALVYHTYLIDTETGKQEIDPFHIPNWEIISWK